MSPRTATMQHVHEITTREFGRLARPLSEDGDGYVQAIDLPGAQYALSLCMTGDETLTVSLLVHDSVDYDRPGLAPYLLREHSRFLFGRYERVGEAGLAIEHTVFADPTISDGLIKRLVLAIHSSTIDTIQTLTATGAVTDSTDGDA